MRDIVQIVRDEIVENIDRNVRVKSIIDSDAMTITVKLCDIKWLKKDRYAVDVDNNQFQVNEIIDVENGIVKFYLPADVSLSRNQVLTITKPTFVFGTIKTANAEFKRMTKADVRQGVPLIFMLGSLNGNDHKFDDPIESDEKPRIFFLDEIDLVNSLDDDRRDQGVRPMLSLKEAFYQSIEESYSLDRTGNSPTRSMSIFGNEDKEGVYEMILDTKLGGVETQPTLSVYKSVACKC